MHSPTPWRMVRDNGLDFLVDAKGQTIAIVDGICDANAKRLIESVNFLDNTTIVEEYVEETLRIRIR